jgi:preprotein translocase subunit SecB
MPLSIQPIDFVAVYQSNMAEKAASASSGADKSE